jgi:hypothetical protein
MNNDSRFIELKKIIFELKNIKRYYSPTVTDLQQRLDAITDLSDQAIHLKKDSILVLEAQARLHALNGHIDQATSLLEEAERLHGSEYHESVLLRTYISEQAIIKHENWDFELQRQVESMVSQLERSRNEYKAVRADKGKIEGFLALAVFGLIALAFVTFLQYRAANVQSKMIDTCVSDIGSLSAFITDDNNAIDSISSDASSASGSDYDSQASALDKINSEVSGVSTDAPETSCAQPSDGNASSSN